MNETNDTTYRDGNAVEESPLPSQPGRWAASVGPTRPRTESIRRLDQREKSESDTESGIKVVDSENDFPFARVTSIRIGSAHVVVHDEQQQLAAVRAMRTASNQINVWFDPNAEEEPVVIERK